MDFPTARRLLGPEGAPAVAAATELRPTAATILVAIATLRKRFPPELATAAVEAVLLRERARAKFAAADRMWFTRESLEQASGDLAARHRADRLKRFGTVLDLGCGIGADALALAATGCRVEAIDADPVRLALAEANARALGVADRVRFHLGDALTLPLPPADAAFTDPGRRAGDRRFLDPEQYQPPLPALLARFPAGFPVAAKIAPGVAREALARFDAEAEFVSAGGELKECVLWFGPLRTANRRATVLRARPGTDGDAAAVAHPRPLEGGAGRLEAGGVRGGSPDGATGGDPSGEAFLTPTCFPAAKESGRGRAAGAISLPREVFTLAAEADEELPFAGPVGAYLFDPDPAVVRADLVGVLAAQLGAAPLEPGVAILSGPDAVVSPFADAYQVEHVAPLDAKKLRDPLRARGVGRVTVLKRALDVDADGFRKGLKLTGGSHRHLILTRAGGRAVAVVAEQVTSSGRSVSS